VIRRGDNHELGLLFLKELAVILVDLRRVAVPGVYLVGRNLNDVAVHIAEPHDLAALRGRRFL
jgi:hypothetical protein